jgi:molybdate transport system substrate-binding protein
LIVACGGDGDSLRVFAASSLTGAFNDIAQAFEAENPGVKVNLDFGGSQRMRSQLEFGAKADVFASADTIQMDALVKQELVAGLPVDFALNSLIVLAMRKGPVNEIADLARPGVKVALANEAVPVGSYSVQVLENLSQDPIYGLGSGFKDDVLANRISVEPNVNYAFQKVVLGEVDAGIVYETDTAKALDVGVMDMLFIPIPDAANVSARYPIAVLNDAPEPELAQLFVQFVLSSAGQNLLQRYGFSSP